MMARILVVEDEALIAILLEDLLRELGHETLGPAMNVKAALALVDNSPDGAILDVKLGSDLSYPVADALIDRGVPFVFATGHGERGIDPRFTSPNVLPKPFSFEEVRDALSSLLRGGDR